MNDVGRNFHLFHASLKQYDNLGEYMNMFDCIFLIVLLKVN